MSYKESLYKMSHTSWKNECVNEHNYAEELQHNERYDLYSGSGFDPFFVCGLAVHVFHLALSHTSGFLMLLMTGLA